MCRTAAEDAHLLQEAEIDGRTVADTLLIAMRTKMEFDECAAVVGVTQFVDSMPQLNDRMTEQICRQWKRTKWHQGALTIALKLGLEKH